MANPPQRPPQEQELRLEQHKATPEHSLNTLEKVLEAVHELEQKVVNKELDPSEQAFTHAWEHIEQASESFSHESEAVRVAVENCKETLEHLDVNVERAAKQLKKLETALTWSKHEHEMPTSAAEQANQNLETQEQLLERTRKAQEQSLDQLNKSLNIDKLNTEGLASTAANTAPLAEMAKFSRQAERTGDLLTEEEADLAVPVTPPVEGPQTAFDQQDERQQEEDKQQGPQQQQPVLQDEQLKDQQKDEQDQDDTDTGDYDDDTTAQSAQTKPEENNTPASTIEDLETIKELVRLETVEHLESMNDSQGHGIFPEKIHERLRYYKTIPSDKRLGIQLNREGQLVVGPILHNTIDLEDHVIIDKQTYLNRIKPELSQQAITWLEDPAHYTNVEEEEQAAAMAA